MSTDESTPKRPTLPTLAQVVGENLRRLRTREHMTQAALTRRIFEQTRQRWTPDQISILENGKREGIAFEDLLVLAFTLRVRLDEFFHSEHFVALAGPLPFRLDNVREALQGGKVRAEFGRPDTDLEPEWLPSQIEADKAVADRLRVDLQTVVDAAVKMWGHTLTEERDARLGDTSDIPPRTLQGKRGAMTRLLTAQIEARLRVDAKINEVRRSK